ncbi:sart-1 family protein dot2 [Quercus suber]|uniref:Sart-1 family protein dot2 n=1 Tax=Quercus suber TaxID=58331 RepID=A0AAW0L4X3_QUESU
MEWSESKDEYREDRDVDSSPMREHWDELEQNGTDKLKRSKRSSDDVLKEREKESGSRDRRKEDRDEREKDRSKDSKVRDKEYDREKYREKERDRDKDRKYRGKDRERERERDAEKDSDRGQDKERAKEKNRDRDRDKERTKEREKDREKHKDRNREKEQEADQDKERLRDRVSRKTPEEDDWSKDDNSNLDYEDNRDASKQGRLSHHAEIEENTRGSLGGANLSASELEERILKKREERLNKNSEGVSEVLSWVSRSHKLEEKRNAEKEKALQLSKIFEERIDMLENVELGEQKQRDEAYKAAKKKTGIYDDKFNDDPDAEKKILPQYDDPTADEGLLALDERGRFSGKAEKKLQEPKKKKSLRKKEKLDLDALEAEALSSRLGVGDLGSWNDARRQAIKEEQERAEAELRNNAYQSAYAKADVASKSLRMEQTLPFKLEEDENPVLLMTMMIFINL